jgi:hypothetical protein
VNNHNGKDGSMKGLSLVSLTLVALVGSAVGLYADEGKTFTGTAAASGTDRRPQLLVDGKRYELKASDKVDASVAEVLARFSKGDTGTYVVKGTRGTVNGVDGIIVDGITPAAQPLPGTGASAGPDRRQYQSKTAGHDGAPGARAPRALSRDTGDSLVNDVVLMTLAVTTVAGLCFVLVLLLWRAPVDNP